jgi:oligopeptide transport system substrate-binding protein
MQWSDGRPFTAYDFEFSGKRILSPETQSPLANLLFDIKGALPYHVGEFANPGFVGLRAVDDATLFVELENPASYFLQLLANFLAVPRHCIESFGENWTDAQHIVTNGPFRMESWDKHTSMQLAKNPRYHGQFTGNIQRVELHLPPDPTKNVEKYALDELDVLDLRFYPMAVYEKTVSQYIGEYISLPSASLSYIGFNVRQPPFKDERLRLAFALAIDKEMLSGVIQKGSVFPATGGLIPPGLPGHSTGIGLPYDPIRAKDLLAQAGYGQGRGFPEVEALTPLNQADPVNESLAAQWEEILGVKIAWRTVSPGLHLVLEKTPPDIFMSYWHADYPDPDDFLGASQFLRWTGWQDRAYLGLLEETRMTADQSKRMKVFERADRLLMEKAAIVPISYHRQHYLLKPWVKRYPTSALFSWFWKDVVIEPH